MKKVNKKMDCAGFLNKISGVINKNFTTIRFVKSKKINYMTGRQNITYGYFKLENNIIIECERGFSEYKGDELVNCQKAWEDNINLRLTDIFTGNFC